MDPERARALIAAERERLLRVRAAAHRLTDEAVQAAASELSRVDQHPADTGSEVEEREKDLAVSARIDAEFAELDAALKRIEEGRYGICEACGQPIPDERLEAKPAARYCVADQARMERSVPPF